MPAEPKKKHSKARKRTRRASIKLGITHLVQCTNCQSKTYPHQVCQSCGFYGGKQISKQTAVKITKA